MATTAAMNNAALAGHEDRHPKGLYVLFATEMWERFSFYSMLALFTLYLQDPTDGFGWTAEKATTVYSWYLAFVYLSPLVGGPAERRPVEAEGLPDLQRRRAAGNLE